MNNGARRDGFAPAPEPPRTWRRWAIEVAAAMGATLIAAALGVLCVVLIGLIWIGPRK